MATMIELVREHDHGTWLTGSDPADVVAQEWEAAGFTVDDVVGWWDAGCWCPVRTAELRDAGLNPKDAAKVEGRFEGTTLGYRYCNGDITIAALSK